MVRTREHSRNSEAGSADGGGVRSRGVDAEVKMGEMSLADGHQADVEVAPEIQESCRNFSLVSWNDSES